MGAGHAIAGEPTWDGEEADATGWPGLESMVCDHCGRLGGRLLRCAACRGAFFCNRDCQRASWSTHSAVCGRRPEPQAHVASRPGSPAPSLPGSPRLPGSATERFREGLEVFNSRRFREALVKANEAAELAASEELWEVKCEALRLRGQCYEQLCDISSAKDAYAAALVEARAKLLGSALTKAEANILLRLGAVATRSSKIGIAVQYQRKAVALLEADGGEKDTLAAAYNNLGISASKHGLMEAAQASFEKAMSLRKETGNVQGLCACVSNLANILRSQDKPKEAAERLEEARDMAHSSGDPRLEKQVLLNLANLYENEIRVGDNNKETDATASLAAADREVASAQNALDAALLRKKEAQTALEQVLAAAAEDKMWPQHALRCRRGLFDLKADPKLSKSHLQKAPVTSNFPTQTLKCHRCECNLQLPAPYEEASCGAPAAVSSEAPAKATGGTFKSSSCNTSCELSAQCDTVDSASGAVAPQDPSSVAVASTASGSANSVVGDQGTSQRLLRCSRCRQTYYCSVECQKKDWREHSSSCRAFTAKASSSDSTCSPDELELRERTCPICLQGLDLLGQTATDSRITILECQHCLHTQCWNELLENGGDDVACPVCRNSLGYSV